VSKSTEHWIEIGGRKLRLTNLEKVLFPAARYTKAKIIDYYARIAPVMIPHLKNRPVTLKRYPAGAHTTPFYEKNCPSHKPGWVSTARMQTSRKEINLCLINDVAALVWIANLASLEVHTYLARSRSLDRPDFLAFDLDPGPPGGVIESGRIALRLRDLLKSAGLESFPKVSGGKGVHVYAPLNTAATFDQTKQFAHELARRMERDDPGGITSNMRKDLRKNKVFVDWSQNDRHKTTVCVYSMRAREMPTVSAPVTWDELESAIRDGDERPLRFSPEQTLERVDAHGDLFAPVLTLKQKLPKVAAIAGEAASGDAGVGEAGARGEKQIDARPVIRAAAGRAGRTRVAGRDARGTPAARADRTRKPRAGEQSRRRTRSP
jgi:bifunctional non-homologous end joining protein LigD